MLKGDGFKAHDAKLGSRLGQVQGLGPPGLARRLAGGGLELPREREDLPLAGGGGREEEIARLRAEVAALGAKLARGDEEGGSGGVAVRGRGGRPVKYEGRPWEAAGVSRRTWERRKRAENGG